MYKINIWKTFGFYALYSVISIILFFLTGIGKFHLLYLFKIFSPYIILYFFIGLLMSIVFIIKTIKKNNNLFVPIDFFKSLIFINLSIQLVLIIYYIFGFYSGLSSIEIIIIIPHHIFFLMWFVYCINIGSFTGFLIRCPINENSEFIVNKKLYDEDRQKKYIKYLKISILFVASVILFSIFFQPQRIVSVGYMGDVFYTNDNILIEKGISRLFNSYKRGDIVSFFSNNKIYIRRVVGLPEEKIKIMGDGRVFINDKQVSDPYVSDNNSSVPDKNSIILETKIPKDKYIMMGDNKDKVNNNNFGMITQKNSIYGKVIFRFYPFSRFGIIKY